MKASNLLMEWDYAAYQRKFHCSIAYIQIGDRIPEWRWIAAVADNLLVYDNPRANPIGQVVCQNVKGELMNDPVKYPVIQMFYKQILPGAYRSSHEGKFYYLVKRHLKSYKIGLSDETFNVLEGDAVGGFTYSRVNKAILLDQPIEGYETIGECEIFSKKVVRLGTTLFADGDPIAFMEQGVCMLRHKNFIPLIGHLLGDKWQIES